MDSPPTTDREPSAGILVGQHDGAPIYRKTGRFGPYLAWNGANLAIRATEDGGAEDGMAVSTMQVEQLCAKRASQLRRDADADPAQPPGPVFGPRRLSPTIDLRRDRRGKAYIRWFPPDQSSAQIRRLDGFPGDPLKSSNAAVLAWLHHRGIS